MGEIIEERLSELGVVLPEPGKAVANYLPYLIDENTLYISGQLPMHDGKVVFCGHVGADISSEQGKEAARLCAINILAQAKSALGSLDRISRLIKLTGFVSSHANFRDHPVVINGASDFMVNLLGDKGKHTRSAVGCSSLPLGASVEIEALFKFTA